MEFAVLDALAPMFAIGMIALSVGWIANTWIRVKHGYPLDGAWGQALHPRGDPEAVERVKLLTQENAQLRAEIGSIKDRLGNVEKIVTDRGYALGHEIEALRALDHKKEEMQ